MKYISTRGGIEHLGFQEVVLMGLADDGGLIVPESLPDVTGRLDAWRKLPYRALAFEILRLFADDLSEAELRGLVEESYAAFPDEVAPLVPVGRFHILELFHGPTLAFKDVALQFLGNLFRHILERRDERLTILGATSGDTGSAAISGVRGKERIEIVVMHPHGRVSPMQARQMTTVLDPNVHNLALEGTFDDCQRILKELFADLAFKRRYRLGAVNSVNWARVLAQIVYYFHAAFRAQEATGAVAVQFAVPTGNFGDILAGYYAARMGLPIARLLLATNENDILCRFFTTGIYAQGAVQPTLSPSMDIQVASNFERYLFDRLGRDAGALRNLMEGFAREKRLAVPVKPEGAVDPLFAAGRGGRAATLACIRTYWEKHHYLLDPHTAVGVSVAEELADPALPCICLATAHPAKFADAVAEATGREDLARHPALDRLSGLPTRVKVLPADSSAVRQFILDAVPLPK